MAAAKRCYSTPLMAKISFLFYGTGTEVSGNTVPTPVLAPNWLKNFLNGRKEQTFFGFRWIMSFMGGKRVAPPKSH